MLFLKWLLIALVSITAYFLLSEKELEIDFFFLQEISSKNIASIEAKKTLNDHDISTINESLVSEAEGKRRGSKLSESAAHIKDIRLNKEEIDLLHGLYEELDPLDPSSLAKILHQLMEYHYSESSSEYGHYLIDRLVIESDVSLNYAEKLESIQYLTNTNKALLTEENIESQTQFLKNALEVQPLEFPSSQWRNNWYERLKFLLDTNNVAYTEESNNEDWRARVDDYQIVREQLMLQVGDQSDVFKIAQEDLRNSYFTIDERAVISMTDNTLDLLNKLNK